MRNEIPRTHRGLRLLAFAVVGLFLLRCSSGGSSGGGSGGGGSGVKCSSSTPCAGANEVCERQVCVPNDGDGTGYKNDPCESTADCQNNLVCGGPPGQLQGNCCFVAGANCATASDCCQFDRYGDPWNLDCTPDGYCG